jgi:predicted RNA-binding protein with PIN domain
MIPLLIVDGYNVIGQWSRAVRLGWSIDISRERLAHMLSEYASYEGLEVVLVFDGAYSERLTRSEEKQGAMTIVFTRQGETADQYIERLADQTPKRREMRVATSDNVEQTVVLGRGAARVPARELLRDIEESRKKQSARIGDKTIKAYPIYQRLPPEQREKLERLRRGK